MGIKREELLELINPDDTSPSLSYWTQILSFFENNQPSLDIQDMRILCAESERCRDFWNTPRTKTITIFRNGKEMEMDQAIMPLNIKKDEVFPKVYDHLARLEHEEEERLRAEEQAREERKKALVEAPGEKAIPLAAAPV